MPKSKDFSIHFSDYLVIVFFSFDEMRIKDRWANTLLNIGRFKNKKNMFNHQKISLITELILFSKDTGMFRSIFRKNLNFLKKVLFRSSFYIIYKLGSGIVSNLAFSIICKIWIKRKIEIISRIETGSIFLSSREEAKQLFLSLSEKAKIFNVKMVEDEYKSISSIQKIPFSFKIFSRKFSKNNGFEFFKQTNLIFIKGECLLPEYHFSFLKRKNLNSLIKKDCQVVIICEGKALKSISIKKTFSENCFNLKNYYSSFKFLPNQVIDISSTQLNKIRRIMASCIRFKGSKVITSSSWSRCLLFCKLSIKTHKKIFFQHENLEIIRMKEQLYLILDFHNRYEYFSCNYIPKKILKKNIVIFFYDLYFKKNNIIKIFEILKHLRSISIGFFFLLKSDDKMFFKIIKTSYFWKKNGVFY